ncbi:lysine N(6)-hydroxylase/L-ornithine N(5)-oxygenase family protein [Neogemmobacter tilapiae]|uniref:L-ornithine N(5)-monooxygenase n=1 Tax=Neogemmobacter tilapiae TaxID=875041 RepID=A0A918WNE9_9RHOB|nr:SidA/IucD/PvdA family monooxygenase [Gemmobacter tilapiae]GHC65364.1 L-ornithine N(5)-monooxygenase [Gemmobacter tilapiae]
MTAQDHRPHDLLGVGFGPSNLSLAVALHEMGQPIRAHFLEARAEFAWHPGMLIPGADMQVSFLKDLVSLRNPQSAFSFVSYLHAKGRLSKFINRKTFFPSRVEFTDYLAWVASQMPVCEYDRRVVGIEPVEAAGQIEAVEVISQNAAGEQDCHRARHLVIAPGGRARWPVVFAGLRGDARVIHSNDYRTKALPRLQPGMRIVVLGGGQSAAEIFGDLAGRAEGLRLDLVLRGRAMRPADDSPFVNEVFDPEQTARFHALPKAQRQKSLTTLAATNYAVADGDNIADLYDLLYEQSVQGGDRLTLHSECLPVHAEATAQGLRLVLDGPEGKRELQADMILLATGYDRALDSSVLHGLTRFQTGEPPARDYRLPMVAGFAPAIFVQGYSEATHGLSDTLLSVLALRAEEIARSVVEQVRGGTLLAAE